MYILTRSGPLENSQNNIYRVEDAALEEQYRDAGYQRYEHSYKIKESYKEYIVICPEFRNETMGLEPVVILPEFLVPGRPYPVYVYLYAIDLYSSAPEKGQRWAAEETRKHFGLSTFAHTTLGRALKAFVRGINALKPGEAESEKTLSDDVSKGTGFPSAQTTELMRKQARAFFLRGRLVGLQKRQTMAVCCELARERFMAYRRFLL
jgi:hypothetical protein